MATSIDRRTWIRSSAVLAGSLAFLGGNVEQLVAKPLAGESATPMSLETDESVILSSPPDIKARLSANENPFGPSEKAKKAIMEALTKSYQYPHISTKALAEKIAAHEEIPVEQITLAAGSSPLLMATAIHFCKDGGNVVSADPTYHDLLTKAESYGATAIRVPVTADYKYDLEAMEKRIDSNTKLVYICNPNNPTATVLDADKLKAFCERVSKKVTVFIDEAYIDYLDNPKEHTLIGSVKSGQNIIVARTFSKLYGFAGLRVGYLIAQPDMIKSITKYSIGPMSISATSASAALASYQDRAFLDDALVKTNASRKYLYDVLKKEGYSYIPSSSNFVMFPIKMEGQRFSDEMMKRGVSIRVWKFASQDWCRVSIGTMEEMKIFAEAFGQIS